MTATSAISSAVKERIAALPLWQGDIHIALSRAASATRAMSSRMTDRKYVVRFGRDYPFHHVFRDREAMTAEAAHRAGFAPELFHAGDGVMVTAFLGAHTYAASDVRANISRVAHMIRQFHTTMPEHILGPGFHVLGVPCHPRLCPHAARRATAAWYRNLPPILPSPRKWKLRNGRCRSSSAITISCPPIYSMMATASG